MSRGHPAAGDQALAALASRLGDAALARGLVLATAESCTGGWVAQLITSIPGSSRWFDRGFVTYSDTAKSQVLGVPEALIARRGAVSEAVVLAMAGGALAASDAGLAVAVSGVAGPGGGSVLKPVGTVWLAFAGAGGAAQALRIHVEGDRRAVRAGAVEAALNGLLRRCGIDPG